MRIRSEKLVLEEVLEGFISGIGSVESDEDLGSFGFEFGSGKTDDLLLASFGGNGGFFERVGGFEDGRLRDRGDLTGGGGGAVGGGRGVGLFG